MTTKDTDRAEVDKVEADRPKARQTVRLDPPTDDIGPHFPSGMSAPEAALAGATADMDDASLAKLRGEESAAAKKARNDD